MSASRKVVPVPGPGGGTGNRFPEPVGTGGTSAPLFESLGAFLERARALGEMEWLVPELIPSSGSLFIVAPPNAGKTWLAFVLAKSAAALGREVFIVEEEGSTKGTAGRLENLSFPADARVLLAINKGVKLENVEMFERLLSVVRRAAAPVLVLDPMAGVSTADENDTNDAKRMCDLLRDLQRANPRLLLVLIHHMSKAGATGERGGMHAARGSSVFTAWCDCQVNLSERPVSPGSGTITFVAEVAKMREAERGRPMRMTIKLGTGEVTLEEEAQSGPPQRKVAIVEVVRKGTGPLSKNQIVGVVRGNRQQVFALVDELVAERVLRSEGGGYVCAPDSAEGQP